MKSGQGFTVIVKTEQSIEKKIFATLGHVQRYTEQYAKIGHVVYGLELITTQVFEDGDRITLDTRNELGEWKTVTGYFHVLSYTSPSGFAIGQVIDASGKFLQAIIGVAGFECGVYRGAMMKAAPVQLELALD